MLKGTLCLILLLCLTISLSQAAHKSGHSDVIYPPQSIPFHFYHDKHLALGISCDTCHDRIWESTEVSERNIPPAEGCLDCHDVESSDARNLTPRSDCAACHVGFNPQRMAKPEPLVLLPANLKFSHKAHLDRGAKCNVCHGDVTKITLATVEHLPRMATCLTCHDGVKAQDACSTCHLTNLNGTLRTRYPEGILKPAGHFKEDNHFSPIWITDHGKSASRWDAYCANCHIRSECTDCHEGKTKPLPIHPNDWITMHPRSAINQSLDCQACHRSESFCRDCHIRLRYTDGSLRKELPEGTLDPIFDPRIVDSQPTRTFHGPGWVFKEKSSPDGETLLRGQNHHANFARRNIQSCASCHREETCLKCHSTTLRGGAGFNPHPPGFKSKGCDHLRKKNIRTCLKCHDSGGSNGGNAETLEALCR